MYCVFHVAARDMELAGQEAGRYSYECRSASVVMPSDKRMSKVPDVTYQ